jgi:hypothetical protein
MLNDAWIPAFAGMTNKRLALGFNQQQPEIPHPHLKSEIHNPKSAIELLHHSALTDKPLYPRRDNLQSRHSGMGVQWHCTHQCIYIWLVKVNGDEKVST